MVTEGLAPTADRTLGFMVPARNARGMVVRLDATLNAILAAHPYPPPLIRLLAEALTLTALVGATMRQDDGQVTVQASAKGGVVDLLACDWRAGELRGYLKYDEQLTVSEGMSLPELFGKGYLAITVDQVSSEERWQGIVPLEGHGLAGALEGWFSQSEQLPTLMRIGVTGSSTTGWLAGGLLMQHLARSEIGGERLDAGEQHPDWEHVAALAATTSTEELADAELTPEALLWRLFHEEQVRVVPGPTPVKGCRCSAAHIRDVLMRFPDAERAGMRDDSGVISVDCQFCSRVFGIAA
ncbi:Hsp33 family molecular chaperone HslO [Sandarakinorhabdus sp. AAP62]|uniref:Hsp33 family molecular chaperone HslO n=1 Tax=Sandarakinorhabdus sp. AAP62 TaxID=1248916 RepID=UPI0002F0DA9C|nr:Hsp33 family molecular chaperone HslO [Sandarakinorhabdus sp. AAP62]